MRIKKHRNIDFRLVDVSSIRAYVKVGMMRLPVFESSRKVQVFGSSLALTLPAMFVRACEIEKGSIVNVLYDFDGVLVLSKCSEVDVVIECLNDIITKMNDVKENVDAVEDVNNA